jgi:hypothetical protein
MKQKNNFSKNEKNEIQKIGITEDSLTSRGGLAFILKYLKNINIIPLISELFKTIRKSRKGKDIENIISQLMMFFIDGSKFTMTRFDELAKDIGYRKTIECSESNMCSSHVIKRFFSMVKMTMFKELQKILFKLFIWRLMLEKPEIIILGLDTMVLNNDDAKKRMGVNYTYKKVCGYHPLHIYWNGFIVNLAFHEGSDSPNHNNDLFTLLKETAEQIRKQYNKDVQIIAVSDSGFFDQKYFKLMEELGVYFICGGKMFDSIKLELMKRLPEEWKRFEKKGAVIEYLNFWDKRDCWEKGYRAIYTKYACENGEFHLEFDRTETIMYTNLEDEKKLKEAGLEKYLDAAEIVNLYHMRAKDELVNRGIKEFVDETLPFKSFESNGVYYYLSVIAYNLLRAFHTDILVSVMPVESYPDTVRRLFIDIAGKIVKTGREIILKFMEEFIDRLNLFVLWEKCETVAPI